MCGLGHGCDETPHRQHRLHRQQSIVLLTVRIHSPSKKFYSSCEHATSHCLSIEASWLIYVRVHGLNFRSGLYGIFGGVEWTTPWMVPLAAGFVVVKVDINRN